MRKEILNGVHLDEDPDQIPKDFHYIGLRVFHRNWLKDLIVKDENGLFWCVVIYPDFSKNAVYLSYDILKDQYQYIVGSFFLEEKAIEFSSIHKREKDVVLLDMSDRRTVLTLCRLHMS